MPEASYNMTCQVDPVTADNALVYSSLNNATLAAGESEASAAMAASSALAAATLATLAVASKNAAFSSETLASESAAASVTKANIATSKATQATIQRELAHKWASESEAVWVSDGVNVPGFSAYHWAKQAQQQNGLTTGGIAQYIADGVADYITYNAIGNSLATTALGTRINQIDAIDARTQADALIMLQEIVDRGIAITNEQTLRLEGEEQLAQDITTLSATMVANIAAAVLVESSARATDYDATAMVMSLLTAQLNDPVTGLPKTRADILTESTARVTENTALASSVTTLQTTIGSHTTAIETAQTVVAGINAKYTVKIDANGYVSGYGLASETNTVTGAALSSFAIRADTFSIGAPAVPASAGQVAVAASKVYPFTVLTTKSEPDINGKVIQPGVYMDSAFITNIAANQVDTRGLTIKDAAGNVLFGSGTGLDFANVTGISRPAPNATVGASFLQTYTFDVTTLSNVISSDFTALPAALTYNSNILKQVSATTSDYNNLVYSKIPNTVSASTCIGSVFTTPTHEYTTGQRVTYSYTSGAIPGLVNNTSYYAIKLSNTTFQLASSLGNATANVPLAITASMNSSAAAIIPSSLDINTDVFGSTTTNNYLAGLPLKYVGTLPGLTSGDTYYAIPIPGSTTTFKVATSYSNALLTTTAIVPTALDINGKFTCASNTIASGTRVLYTTASLIPGLNLTTNYYYARLSSTEFKLATTVPLATGASPSFFVADVIPSAINVTTHIITVNSNPFPNGMGVKLTTAIGGLVANTLYYAVQSTGTTLGLVTTEQRVLDHNANPNGLTLTALATSAKGTTFTTAGAVPETGTEVKYITTTTQLGGLVKNSFYFIIKISTTTFKLATTKDKATALTPNINITGTPTLIMKTSSSFVAPLATLTAIIPATSKIYYPTVTVSGTTNATAATFTTTFAVSLDSATGLNTVKFTPAITDAKFVPNTSTGKTVSFRVPNASSYLMAGINNKDTISSYGNMFAAFEIKGASYNIWINGVKKWDVDAIGGVSANTLFTIVYSQLTGQLRFFVNESEVYGGLSVSNAPMGFVAAFKTLDSSINSIVTGASLTSIVLKDDNNIQGRLTNSNASTFIADAAITSAMIGSVQLVGKNAFSVKSTTQFGARMEMDCEVIKIFDETSTSGTTGLRVKLGNLDA